MYIHGWKENLRQNDVELIPRSYASRGGWNVILLDYDSITDGDYIIVDHNAIKVNDTLHFVVAKIFVNVFGIYSGKIALPNSWRNSSGGIQRPFSGY